MSNLAQRIAALQAEYGSPDLAVAHLLCDRHPADAVAATLVGPDLDAWCCAPAPNWAGGSDTNREWIARDHFGGGSAPPSALVPGRDQRMARLTAFLTPKGGSRAGIPTRRPPYRSTGDPG